MELKPERVPGLDLLRATAILLVLVSHAPLLWLRHVELQPLGVLGVDLFFVLSGYLIGGILLETGARLRCPRVLFGFWLSRWLRTLPNFYLLLLVNVALILWVIPQRRVRWESVKQVALFMQNLTAAPPSFYVEAWSLSVEEWFYLVTPLALSLALAAGTSLRFAVAVVLVLMFGGPLVLRAGLPVSGDWTATINLTVVLRVDALACGVAAAWFAREYGEVWRRGAPVAGCIGLGGMGVCSLIAYREGFSQAWLAQTFFPLAQPAVCALLLPAMTRWRGFANRGLAQAFSAIARWSYSLYLVNMPLCFLGVTHLGPRLKEHWLGVVCGDALYFAASLALAAALYRWFERPFLRMREKISWCREAADARQAGKTRAPHAPVVSLASVSGE